MCQGQCVGGLDGGIFADMGRYFNTTGLCDPRKHYMVDPLRGM